MARNAEYFLKKRTKENILPSVLELKLQESQSLAAATSNSCLHRKVWVSVWNRGQREQPVLEQWSYCNERRCILSILCFLIAAVCEAVLSDDTCSPSGKLWTPKCLPGAKCWPTVCQQDNTDSLSLGIKPMLYNISLVQYMSVQAICIPLFHNKWHSIGRQTGIHGGNKQQSQCCFINYEIPAPFIN